MNRSLPAASGSRAPAIPGSCDPAILPKRRVLLVQPSLQPPGGGNGVAAWALQALAPVHDVTVLSWTPVDARAIDEFFGTSLQGLRFACERVPAHWRAVPECLPVPASLLRSSVLMRYTRRLSPRFDVVLGLHNETDFGRRGIQYVHYPTYLRPRPQVDLRWYHVAPALDAYYAAADALAGFSTARMRDNVTLANSQWTADRLSAASGIAAHVVYPPVVTAGEPTAWSTRHSGFLTMGRISPEKDLQRVLRLLAAVHTRIPSLTLTIVGTYDEKTRGYLGSLHALVRSLDAERWVTFRHHLSRAEVQDLIASHRYGIHGMREEHFGMAPAEMVCGGMVVWVPNGGGQTEIVGDEPLLRYDTDEEAIANITHVLQHPAAQDRLREHLHSHSTRFGTGTFVAAIRTAVANFTE